jgi:hypothetical protein
MPRRQASPDTPAVDAKVQAFLDHLDHPHKPAIVALRSLILSLDPRIREDVKWNAPSFYIEEHFATFRLHPATAIQLVLHTGAKKRARTDEIKVADPRGLLKWAAADRCILTLCDAEEAHARQDEIAGILRQWIDQL